MTERQEAYITATATPDYLRDAHVLVLTRRERDFIEIWRKNPKALALAVDPKFAQLWGRICNIYGMVRRREIEPIIVIDMVRLEPYTLNDVVDKST